MLISRKRFYSTIQELAEQNNAQAIVTRAALDQLRDRIAAENNDMRTNIDGLRTMLNEFTRNGFAEYQTALNNIRQRVGDSNEALSGMQASLDRISFLVENSYATLRTDAWSPESAESVRCVLRNLSPFAAKGREKVRIGGSADGGYVMIDDFADIDTALSLGVGDEISWDRTIAQKGIKIKQFDYSIDSSPLAEDGVEFFKLLIGPHTAENVASLQSITDAHTFANKATSILKMDIEGDEWSVIETTNMLTLRRFRQIIVEFHHLDRLRDNQFAKRAADCFRKLLGGFFVVHLHANNCGLACNIGNTFVPETLEVTYANRECYEPVETTEIFPTSLDRPNQPGRADIFLGTFKF